MRPARHAGGFTGDAYTNSIRVKRKAGDRYKIATVNEEQFQTFVLQDGDSLMVDSVIPYYDNRIIIPVQSGDPENMS